MTARGPQWPRAVRAVGDTMSQMGQPNKIGHRYCSAGLSSTAELFIGGQHRRSVPLANIKEPNGEPVSMR